MMRSLFSGVAGLKTHQTKMDVIGNNIANVNTVAFKSSVMIFSDLMSQTTQRASGANATTGTGGINARQIGLGVKGAAINIDITTQGASQSTGNPFDLMITGENFFVVSDGISNYFTRDGSFYIDGAGNLAMTSNGYNVMGWNVDPETGNIVRDTVAALRIMNQANMTYPPEATSMATIAGIIDSNDTDVTSANGKVVNLNFFDARGYEYTAKIVFKQSDSEDLNEYSIELTKLLDSNGNEIEIPDGLEQALLGTKTAVQKKATVVQINPDVNGWNGAQLQDTTTSDVIADLTQVSDFDNPTADDMVILDKIAAAYGYEGSTKEFLKLATIDESTDPTTVTTVANILAAGKANAADPVFADFIAASQAEDGFSIDGRSYEGSNITFNAANGNFNGVGGISTQETLVLRLSQLGSGNFSDITIDFSDCGNWDNKGTSTVSADKGIADNSGAVLGTGRRLGDMIGLSVQQNGMIYASYDNGMTKLLGQIATAKFPNASGLEKQGSNLYGSTLNSGEFDGIGVDVTADGGYITTGELEMSNVDLSTEFTQMITTQRGFQANSRIITVSDTLLEELTNLKR